jgi:hypothetical protein
MLVSQGDTHVYKRSKLTGSFTVSVTVGSAVAIEAAMAAHVRAAIERTMLSSIFSATSS